MCLSEIDCEARFNMYSQEWELRQRHRRGIEIQLFFFFSGVGNARGIREAEWKQEVQKSFGQSTEFQNKIVEIGENGG